jgi:hypothetical protein
MQRCIPGAVLRTHFGMLSSLAGLRDDGLRYADEHCTARLPAACARFTTDLTR